MTSTVTFEEQVTRDPRKDMLLNGSIDKLPIACDSMEELILEVRKYSDNDSYFMQIFPLFLDRVFGESVMDNVSESSWVRGDRGGWLKRAAESTRSTLTTRRITDSSRSRRLERTNAFISQYGMSDFASRLLHLFVPEGCVSKMVNDDQYYNYLLSANFDILPKKVKMKWQGLMAYNCIRSPTNHVMYDYWCHRSNTISSSLMTTPNRNNMLVNSTTDINDRNSSSGSGIVLNLSLQNYFFMAFIRYPIVELEAFPQNNSRGITDHHDAFFYDSRDHDCYYC